MEHVLLGIAPEPQSHLADSIVVKEYALQIRQIWALSRAQRMRSDRVRTALRGLCQNLVIGYHDGVALVRFDLQSLGAV